MEIYKKQVKALNLAIAEQMCNNKMNGNDSIIYSIKESKEEGIKQDDMLVMSDITTKTMNLYKSMVLPEKTASQNTPENNKKMNNGPVLESLGKTRKSETNNNAEEKKQHLDNNGKSSKNVPMEVTQDNRSVYSKMTLETKDNGNVKKTKQTDTKENQEDDQVDSLEKDLGSETISLMTG